MSTFLALLVKALYVILALVVFGILILVHELGHFLAARAFKVTVKEFSIGMGPKLFSKESKKTKTNFSLRALPIGGYVSMVGEDETDEDPNALYKKPVYQRFIIMIAGSFMNLLLGAILVLSLVLSSGHIYGTQISGFVENAYTQKGGLNEGDIITEIGNHSVYTLYDLSYTIMRDCTGPIDVTVIRNGEKTVIKDVEFYTTENEGHIYGARDFYIEEVNFSFGNIIKQTFFRSTAMVQMVFDSVIDLIRGEYSVKEMSGPVGITKTISDAASEIPSDGGETLFYLISLLAVNLGVMNLLPFPALDGFRALLLIFEGVSGKQIKKEIEGYINLVGFALLIILMIVVTFTDVTSLF